MLYRYYDQQTKDRLRKNKRLLKALNKNNNKHSIKQNYYLLNKNKYVFKNNYTSAKKIVEL